MIRQAYQQLDDFGKQVDNGYSLEPQPLPKKQPPPVPEKKPTFREAVEAQTPQKQKPVAKTSDPSSLDELDKQMQATFGTKPLKQQSAERSAMQNQNKQQSAQTASPKPKERMVISEDEYKTIVKKLGKDGAELLLKSGQIEKQSEPKQKQGNEKQKQQTPQQTPQPEAEKQQQIVKPPPPPGQRIPSPPVYETTQAGIELQGQDPTLDSHIVASGAFDATPQQLQEFAQMLGLPSPEAIENGHQLRLAITQSNAQQTLRDVLAKTGYLPAEPEQPSMFRDFRKGFGEGYAKTSGLNLAKRAGGKILDKVADAAVGRLKGRFQAGQYAAAGMKPWNEMTPLERSDYKDEEDYNRQCKSYGKKEVDRLQAQGKSEKPGIEMPSKKVDNEDAKEGDQLGLFGEGKKASKTTKFKLENEKEKGKQKLMFDRMNDHPDQQSLFSTFAEAVERYSADLKKK